MPEHDLIPFRDSSESTVRVCITLACPCPETFDAYSAADYIQRVWGQVRGTASTFDRSIRASLEV